MAALYTNENVARRVVERLRELGHDVLTSLEAANANRGVSDSEVPRYAASAERIVVTNNRADFRKLHRAGCRHVGIVIYTVDADFEGLADRIDAGLRDVAGNPRFLVSVTQTGHTLL